MSLMKKTIRRPQSSSELVYVELRAHHMALRVQLLMTRTISIAESSRHQSQSDVMQSDVISRNQRTISIAESSRR